MRRLCADDRRTNLPTTGRTPRSWTSDSSKISIAPVSLHDIGKVAVPDSILQKHGRLTSEEFEAIKNHVVVGGRDDRDGSRSRRLRHFHGHGSRDHQISPRKIRRYRLLCRPARQEIPLSARIVALADVYDAITSPRIYKPPYDPDVARDIIVRESGTHFDPLVVDAFLARFDDFKMIATQTSEGRVSKCVVKRLTCPQCRCKSRFQPGRRLLDFRPTFPKKPKSLGKTKLFGRTRRCWQTPANSASDPDGG